MLKLTKRTEYALLALQYLQHQPANSVTSAREIAEHYQMPFELLAKILQQLVKEDIVLPVKGAKGGYQLSGNLRNISLWNFLETIENSMGIVDCFVNVDCASIDNCDIRTPMKRINDALKSTFVDLSVFDIVKPNNLKEVIR